MKKTYQIPEIEVMLVETTELMQASLGVFSEQEDVVTDPTLIKSREFIFLDED